MIVWRYFLIVAFPLEEALEKGDGWFACCWLLNSTIVAMSFMHNVDIFPPKVRWKWCKSCAFWWSVVTGILPRQGASCDFGLLEELAWKFAKDSFFGAAQAAWPEKKTSTAPFWRWEIGKIWSVETSGILMNFVEYQEKCSDFGRLERMRERRIKDSFFWFEVFLNCSILSISNLFDIVLLPRSLYVKPSDEDKSDHVHEASSKLLGRLQEAASGSNLEFGRWCEDCWCLSFVCTEGRIFLCAKGLGKTSWFWFEFSKIMEVGALIMTLMATSSNSYLHRQLQKASSHRSFDSASGILFNQDMAQRSLPWSNKKQIMHQWRSTRNIDWVCSTEWWVPGPISCMWRQTGNCNATGEREPERDRLCSESVPLGNSGFCDCNGDNEKNGHLSKPEVMRRMALWIV